MTEDAAARIAARLTELWRTSRPTILERMTILHSACDSLSRNPLNTEARASGLEAAHKLSGVLGVFGLPQGSEIASSIEFLLKSGEPLTPDDLSTLREHIADLDAVIASRSDS
jgi:HPt (histidine-containing phosphotransfer) domain-containing protein